MNLKSSVHNSSFVNNPSRGHGLFLNDWIMLFLIQKIFHKYHTEDWTVAKVQCKFEVEDLDDCGFEAREKKAATA